MFNYSCQETKIFHFLRRTPWSKVLNLLIEDLVILYRYASVYPNHLKQSLSTEPDKSLVCSEA